MPSSRTWLTFCLVAAPWILGTATPTGDGSTAMKAGASTLRDAQTYLAPRLEPASVKVENQTLEFGGLALVMDAGTVSRVSAGGQVVGLYFKGKGRMAYLSRDPAEAAALRFNLKGNAGLEPVEVPGGLQVEDGLQEALIFLEGRPIPTFPGEPGKTPQDAFDTLLDWFDADNLPFPGHLAVLRSANTPGKATVEGFLRGGSGRYLFLRDEATERKETLSLVEWREIPGVPYLKVIPLSCTWLEGTQFRPPSPTAQVTMVDLDIKVKQGATLDIGVVETVVPRLEGQQVLDFQLRSFEISRPNTVAYEKVPVRLQSVETEDGQPLPFDHRMNRLVVKFPKPLQAGVPVKVRFRVTGAFLRERVNLQTLDLGGDAWFPMTNPVDQGFKAHCRLEVDKPFKGVIPGRILRQEATATGSLLETAVDVPVARLAFTVGPYEEKVYRDPRTKVAIHVHGYAASPSKARTLRTVKAIQGVIAYYQTFLGPFPFEDLHVVPSIGGPSKGALPGMMDCPASVGGFSMSNEQVTHDLAQQYWGVVVRARGLDEELLARALGHFCEIDALRAMPGVGERAADRDEAWHASMKNKGDEASSIARSPWLVYPLRSVGGVQKAALQTTKTSRLLDRIHQEIGDAAFKTFLSALQREFAWKPMDAMDLPLLLARITGTDWMPYFEKHYWGTEALD